MSIAVYVLVILEATLIHAPFWACAISFCLYMYISLAGQPLHKRRKGLHGQLRITSLCYRVSSGQVVQGASSNWMLIVVNCDVFLRCSGRPFRRAPYSTILDACNAVSMCAQHEAALTSKCIIVV